MSVSFPKSGKCLAIISSLKKIFFNVFIYFWNRERQSMNRGGAEREGDTESEAGSRLWAVSTEPDVGLEPTNCEITPWAGATCLTDWATQVLPHSLVKNMEVGRFNIYTRLCNRHQHLIPEHCRSSPQKESLYHEQWLPVPLTLPPLETTNLLSISGFACSGHFMS